MSNNLAAFFVALTLGVLYGVTLNVSQAVTTEPPFEGRNSYQLGLINVGLAIGATFGSFFGGFISDRAGPKITLGGGVLSCLVCVVWMWTQQENLALLVVLRAISGLGIGVATSIGPQYIGEQASAERRGMFGTMFQLFICLGQLLSFATLYGFHQITVHDENNHNAWRYNILVTGIWALFFLLGWFLLPESAGFLANRTRRNAAAASSRSASAINDDADADTPDQPSIWDDVASVFKAAVTSRRAFIVGVMLAAFQQITGINVFMLYSVSIFESVGWTGDLSRIASVVMGAWNFVSVVVAIFLVDNAGRKPLLISGFFLMLLGLISITIMGFLDNSNPLAIGAKIGFVVPSVALYLLGFQIGPGPMFFVTVSELYDADVRGRAMGLMVGINWISNIVVSYLFPTLFEKWGMPVFIIFAVLSLIVIIFVIVSVREMKGKVLQGLEEEEEPLKGQESSSYLSGGGGGGYGSSE